MAQGIFLNSNVTSLQVQRCLGQSTKAVHDSYNGLSSGLRINKASDDAAGLAIASGLNVDQKVYQQGVKNLNDGISMFNIADTAIESLSNIVIRLTELAEQSANGTLGTKQRAALDEEAQNLSAEYFRIARSAKFNGINLLDGAVQEVTLQAGYGIQGGLTGGFGGLMGTGSFTGGSTIAYGLNNMISSAEIGDLDGDGIQDLVTTRAQGAYIGILTQLGRGDATFRESNFYSEAEFDPEAVNLSDVNQDGVLDVIAVGTGIDSLVPNYAAATVWTGNGDGSFRSTVSYRLVPTDITNSTTAYDSAMGDINGDGILDLAAACGVSEYGFAAFQLGLGDGTFGPAYTLATESATTLGIVLKDINRDGALDVITVGTGDDLVGYTTIRLGNGDGTFGAALSYASESSCSSEPVLADLNSDGCFDLLTAELAATDAYFTVRIGHGDGTFVAASSYLVSDYAVTETEVADLDGDGSLDVITSGWTDSMDSYVSVNLGRGDGTFAANTTNSMGRGGSYALMVGDLNGDMVLDILGTTSNSKTYPTYLTPLIANTQSGTSPLLPFDLSTMAGARQALPIFKYKLEQLASQRGEIGTFQTRIGVVLNNLQVASENFASAESQIKDADISIESAKLLKQQILQQTNAAILRQVNLQPAIALTLLSDI